VSNFSVDRSDLSSEWNESILDCIIIGAGIVGTALARYLSRLDLRVAVVEKAWDVGMGATCRNSGVLHSGINYLPGSLRARLCLEGRELFQMWCIENHIPFSVPGKLVIAQQDSDKASLDRLRAWGESNGVPGLRQLSATDVEELQPGIRAVAGLHVPTSGIVSPYAATIAFAEDACTNRVRFFLGCEVATIERRHDVFLVKTSRGQLRSRWVINAAGLSADGIANGLDSNLPTVYPCRGEYIMCPQLVNLLGLESPALTAAPAIARYVVEEIMAARETLSYKPEDSIVEYQWQKRFDDLSESEKQTLVRRHPDYGEIVCRCEGVTRYEVLQATRNVLGVKTLAGIKYRTRVMMGRCGGGYCLPRIVRLLQEEYNWRPSQFYLKSDRSPLFTGYVKDQSASWHCV